MKFLANALWFSENIGMSLYQKRVIVRNVCIDLAHCSQADVAITIVNKQITTCEQLQLNCPVRKNYGSCRSF